MLKPVVSIDFPAGPQGFDQAPTGRPTEGQEGRNRERSGGKGQSGQRTALQRTTFFCTPLLLLLLLPHIRVKLPVTAPTHATKRRSRQLTARTAAAVNQSTRHGAWKNPASLARLRNRCSSAGQHQAAA